jgi:serine protease Do
MKRQWIAIVMVAILGFLVGEWYIIHKQPAALQSSSDKVQTAAYNLAISGGAPSVADIVENVGPAVVYIEASGTGGNDNPLFRIYGFELPRTVQKATGTGFIIDQGGYIMTNQHVVNGAQSIEVKVQGESKPYTATLVGQDYELDVAILKIDAVGLPIIPMGDSDSMRQGDWVIAIGNPLGLDHTVTVGVVSAKGRPITIQDRNYKNLIQTDAAINSGNSGGPLINMTGQVIAINTAISSDAQGIGFAIPINTAKGIMNELISTGKVVRPYMGISMVDMSDEIASQLKVTADTKGAVVANVLPDSPAGLAGLKYLDILVSIDSNPMNNPADVQNFIAKQKVGQTIQLGVIRNGQKIDLAVILKEKP